MSLLCWNFSQTNNAKPASISTHKDGAKNVVVPLLWLVKCHLCATVYQRCVFVCMCRRLVMLIIKLNIPPHPKAASPAGRLSRGNPDSVQHIQHDWGVCCQRSALEESQYSSELNLRIRWEHTENNLLCIREIKGGRLSSVFCRHSAWRESQDWKSICSFACHITDLESPLAFGKPRTLPH